MPRVSDAAKKWEANEIKYLVWLGKQTRKKVHAAALKGMKEAWKKKEWKAEWKKMENAMKDAMRKKKEGWEKSEQQIQKKVATQMKRDIKSSQVKGPRRATKAAKAKKA